MSANDGDVQVVSSPLDQFPLDEVAWFHLDPDRRSGQRRSVDPRHFSPGADVIEDWIRHFHHGAVKLAPATSHDWHRDYAECQWLGDRNECKQQLVWFGDAARHPGRRSVAAVDDDGRLLFEWTPGDLAEGVRVADPLGEYIYEPHATVLAGDLVDALAFECGLSRIALNVAYLTGSLVEHPALTSFRILEMTRVREKDVLAALKRHGAGWVEVKKRGVSHHLVQRFSGLNLSGDEPRVLILTRHNDRHIALICQRR